MPNHACHLHADPEALDRAVLVEQIRYLYALMPTLVGAIVPAALVVAAAHWAYIPSTRLLSWLAVVALVLLGRIWLWQRWRGAGASQYERIWLLRFRAGIMITGAVWGLGGALFYGSDNEVARAMLAMTLAGMGAASVASMAVDRVSAFSYIVPAAPPLLICLLWTGTSVSIGLALLMMLGSAFVMLGAVRTHRSLVDNIRLRHASDAYALALEESEGRWKFALEGAGDGIADCDLSTGRATVSRRWREIQGRSDGPAEVGFCDWTQSVHPDDRDMVLGELQRCLDGSAPFVTAEHRIDAGHLGWLWVSMRAMVVTRAADGKPLRVIATRSDISERKRTEANLLEGKQRLRLIFDAATDGLVLRNRAGKVLECNVAAVRILGGVPPHTGEEAVLPSGVRMTHENGSELDFEEFPTVIALRSGAPVMGRVVGLHRPNGEFAWLSLNVVPLLDEHGVAVVAVTSYTDITERKRSELVLQESRQRLQLIFDVSTDGLVLRDRDGKVLECNRAAERILGLNAAQIGDREPLPEGVRTVDENGQDVSIDAHPTARALRDGLPVREELMAMYRPDDSFRWISTTAVPLLDDHGAVSLVVSSYADITARKLVEQRLDQRNRDLERATREAQALAEAKSNFLANMSHEMRSPLAAILGYAERALRPNSGESALRSALTTSARSAQHLLQILDDVLDAARLDVGQMRVHAVAVDVVSVCADVIELMEPAAQAKSLAMYRQWQWPLPETVHTDPLRLKQILMNLLGNAIKFTETGEVTLKLAADVTRQRLQIAVRDSGIGMSAEQQQRLYQPFAQGDSSHSRQYGGTGLGLYISAELVHRMGGSIAVDSAPGNGTCVTVELPIDADAVWLQQPAPATSAPSLPAPTPQSPLQGRVLLAEDDVFLRELMVTLLADTGVSVVSVDNGREAVTAARGGDFDLLMLDMHMPVLDGQSAARELRANGASIPIIALTADLLPGSIDAHLEAGCSAVLGKPVNTQELHNVLSQHLGTRHQQRLLNCPVEAGLARARERFVSRCRSEWPQLWESNANRALDATALLERLRRYQDTARFLGLPDLQGALIAAEGPARAQSGDALVEALARIRLAIDAT